jgi:hypothetical protein
MHDAVAALRSVGEYASQETNLHKLRDLLGEINRVLDRIEKRVAILEPRKPM